VSIFDLAHKRIAEKKLRVAELEAKLHDEDALQRAASWAFDGVRVAWNGADATVWARRYGEDRVAFCVVNTDEGHMERLLDKWRQEQVADYLGIRA
jgi:hypothetical protein